jgi:hypothetical protein
MKKQPQYLKLHSFAHRVESAGACHEVSVAEGGSWDLASRLTPNLRHQNQTHPVAPHCHPTEHCRCRPVAPHRRPATKPRRQPDVLRCPPVVARHRPFAPPLPLYGWSSSTSSSSSASSHVHHLSPITYN